ncbi:MAG: hypothetical protein ACRELF_10665, partial [Gemmataceae bacterium]
MSTVDDLARRGLIENRVAPSGKASGVQSTFRATPTLLGAIPREVVLHAEHVAGELIRLRSDERRWVDYHDTERTRLMRRFLHEQNEALTATLIELDAPGISNDRGILRVNSDVVLFPAMRALYRVFKGNWGHGGRMYGGWWQQVPKQMRAFFQIDGERVIECDYPQLHPRLLYRLAGQPLEGDAYTLPGWDRKLAKKAFNILLNANDYRAAIGAVANL